jgi:NTP-dependent ternary system trypsin peptidase co-occuring protein
MWGRVPDEPAKPAQTSLWRLAAVAALVYLAFFLLTSLVLPRLGVRAVMQSGPESLPASLDLTALLREVKTEVNAATVEMLKNRESAMFQVKELVIEVNFAITQEVGADAPKLVPIGVNSKVSAEKVHRITLTLDPVPDLDKSRKGTKGDIPDKIDVTVD